MPDNNDAIKYISKIKMPNGNVYDMKDALLRHQLNVLMGIEEPDERDGDSEDKQ